MQFILVGLGGFLGAIARFSISRALSSVGPATLASVPTFPLATLVVNALGSLLIGFLVMLPAFAASASTPRLLFVTGFLGAFTTFSAFSLETLGLFESAQPGKALLNIGLNLVVCLCFVWFGASIGRALTPALS